MEEIVFDTNQLIDFLKKGKRDLKGFTTIFNIIEFPKAVEFEELTVIYPTLEDYDESLNISFDLLQKGNPLPAIDMMVVAICIRRNLTLCTRDTHFASIKSIRKNFRLELVN